ncbi:glycoside hydrolase family 18 [Gemmatirosa kalamazoonensis]|uniref:chitinase n=1 Tax=Gemmatirosa kalamazoonensis TaxID=861299 RepID=W0RA28_9BACT|nr:glycosyl hydrolase family 18 protein [Gemmatirosa kalamazoonensis]AHG87656.1 glycoside hydrolase family 18 [Gemmatirosa kalamazoonensis]
MPHRRVAAAVVRTSAHAVALTALVALAACGPDGHTLTAPTTSASAEKASRVLPSAPQSVQATAGDAQATVAWQPPTSSGTSALASYTVTSSPGGIKVTVTAPTTAATVTGLTNGTKYTFTVVATNASGSGPASSRSNAVTPKALTVPNAAPTATISAPTSGASVAQGASVTFTGAGTDPEDGTLSGASLVWTSSINGQIGTGASFSTTTLSAGTHTITLKATDSKGASVTTTRSITVVAPTTTAPAPAPSSRWVSGYYTGYQRDLYPETSVDFTYMTHVIVGAALPKSAGGVDTAFFVDNVNGPKMARNLTARAHQYGRKAIMMLGGDGFHSQLVSATSSTYRATFVANLVKVVNTLGFDGIDVDWEPVDDVDKPAVLQFLKDLRAAKPGIILTFPVGWVNTNFGADPWYAQLAPLVDQFNMMTYGMADNWGGWTSWHQAALSGEAGNHPSSIAGSAKAYIQAGVPAAKIGVGVGSYGSCWQGVSSMLASIDGTPATVTANDNDMSFANIMSLYYNSAAYRWDATAQAGYLSFASPTGPNQCTMISYEDARSVAAKGAYVKSAGLGGAIVWTIGEGHLPSAASGQQDPLLQALFGAMQ